jgi:Domain of unknown function (DUF4203)
MFWTILVGIALIALGILLLFRGYGFFRILLPIWAFLAGFGITASGIASLLGSGFVGTTIGILAGLVVGLVLAALSYLFYFIAVLILGATVGYALGAGLMVALGLTSWIFTVPVGLLFGAVGLVVALLANLQKYLPIVFTALAGATATLAGALVAVGGVSLDQLQGQDLFRPLAGSSWLAIAIWALLAGVGIWVQARANAGRVELPPETAWSQSPTLPGQS